MKKIIVMLAVLVIAAPAMAAVTVSCVGDGTTCTVSYVADGNLPRAFALEIGISAGTIVSVDNLNADFWVYPGSIVIVDGVVTDVGTPVAEGGVGESSMVIEMASLYEEGVDPAPAASGVLFSFDASAGCDVTIGENAQRGGIVMEAPDEDPDETISGCTIPGGWAYPACWDYLTQCYGDSDDTGDVKASDFLALKDSWYKVYPDGLYDPCADFDRNGDVKAADFLTLKNNWYQTVPTDCPQGDLNEIYKP